MRSRTSLLALVLVLAAASPWAQETANERVILLQDGGRVVLRADGSMGHYDAAGNPVAMAQGQAMVAKDGTRIMMKDDTLWRQIVERGVVNYALATTLPWREDDAKQKSIALADGGRIALRDDGSMIHYDAAGNVVQMKDGTAMVAKDGSRILMHNGVLWGTSTNRNRPR